MYMVHFALKSILVLMFLVQIGNIFAKQNDKTMFIERNCRYSHLILSLLSLSLPRSKHNVEVADQEKKLEVTRSDVGSHGDGVGAFRSEWEVREVTVQQASASAQKPQRRTRQPPG